MRDRSDLITHYFEYLITEFGFHIEQKEFDYQMFGNAFVRFKSTKVGIEVVIDRNQVLISLGDITKPRREWLEFSEVLRYFSPTEIAYIFYAKSENMAWDEAVEAQLKRTSYLLRRYCEPILMGNVETNAG